MNTRKRCTLEEAAEQVEYTKANNESWAYAIARIAYSSGWSVGAIEAEIDRQFHSWCGDHGHDYT
jgi:hypothetical protein